MFPTFRKKDDNFFSCISKMQSEPKQTLFIDYSYIQAVKALPLQNVIKQNNTQIQNAAQE